MIFGYLKYLLLARHWRGFGVHSPFAFSVLSEVIFNKHYQDVFTNIETIRKEMLKDKGTIFIKDFGTGSRILSVNNTTVDRIAKNSSLRFKYCKVLFNAVRFLEPSEIVELGSSLGISTLYLAMANPDIKVYTIEGCPKRAAIAKRNFRKLQADNIVLYNERFEDALARTLKINQRKNKLIFIDGNHNYSSTISYFNIILRMTTRESVLLIDDIHWSKDMEKAWAEIQNHNLVTLTIDLFFMGIVFFSENLSGNNLLVRY